MKKPYRIERRRVSKTNGPWMYWGNFSTFAKARESIALEHSLRAVSLYEYRILDTETRNVIQEGL